MNSIAIGVVNYNTRELLRACLQAALREAPSELLVVDNASSDGSADMVKKEFPDVTLVENERNLGFGAAANQVIAHSRMQYVLVLNSDTRVQPGVIPALSAYLDQNPHVAILGPRIVNADGSTQQSCF